MDGKCCDQTTNTFIGTAVQPCMWKRGATSCPKL